MTTEKLNTAGKLQVTVLSVILGIPLLFVAGVLIVALVRAMIP